MFKIQLRENGQTAFPDTSTSLIEPSLALLAMMTRRTPVAKPTTPKHALFFPITANRSLVKS
jgi:hypothetical protein